MRARVFVPVLIVLSAATGAAVFFFDHGGHLAAVHGVIDAVSGSKTADAPAASPVHQPLSNVDVYMRLLVSMFLAALIGMEREYRHKPAGLRTNVMVGLGACLMTLASVRSLDLFPEVKGLDPTRIAAQIITGIGFIGAGAILRPEKGKGHIVGLTTAATLWVVCGLGIAVGLGFYAEAVATTALVFFTFYALGKIVRKVQEFARLHPPADFHDEDDTSVHNETKEH